MRRQIIVGFPNGVGSIKVRPSHKQRINGMAKVLSTSSYGKSRWSSTLYPHRDLTQDPHAVFLLRMSHNKHINVGHLEIGFCSRKRRSLFLNELSKAQPWALNAALIRDANRCSHESSVCWEGAVVVGGCSCTASLANAISANKGGAGQALKGWFGRQFPNTRYYD